MQTFCLVVCKHFFFFMYECGTKVSEYLFLFVFSLQHMIIYSALCVNRCVQDVRSGVST